MLRESSARPAGERASHRPYIIYRRALLQDYDPSQQAAGLNEVIPRLPVISLILVAGDARKSQDSKEE